MDFSESKFGPTVLDIVFEAFYRPVDTKAFVKWVDAGVCLDDVLDAADYFQFGALKEGVQKVFGEDMSGKGDAFVVKAVESLLRTFLFEKPPNWIAAWLYGNVVKVFGRVDSVVLPDVVVVMAVHGIAIQAVGGEAAKFELLLKACKMIEDEGKKAMIRRAVPQLVNVIEVPVDKVFEMATSLEDVKMLIVEPRSKVVNPEVVAHVQDRRKKICKLCRQVGRTQRLDLNGRCIRCGYM
ncbi:hypothetical protein HDU97_006441 [Phlyctochytrium planicorne]|nr:hypothetical protein HDU97_006441 [Phlyctochytrium planicorne]